MEYDLPIERSIKVTPMITEGLQPLPLHFEELKSKGQQFLMTTFFQKISVKSSTVEHPQPLHIICS